MFILFGICFLFHQIWGNAINIELAHRKALLSIIILTHSNISKVAV